MRDGKGQVIRTYGYRGVRGAGPSSIKVNLYRSPRCVPLPEPFFVYMKRWKEKSRWNKEERKTKNTEVLRLCKGERERELLKNTER